MGRNVLIVEDEILVALDLEHIVTSAGHEVVGVVADWASANALNVSVDVALVDLNLRDGATGPRVAELLASRHGAKIVFVTANPAQIGVPPPTAAGYIQKPFERGTIVAALELVSSGGATLTPKGFQPFETGA